jgi:hypothetical protein
MNNASPFLNDTLAERLRRRPAKPMGSPRVGSNPTGVVLPAAPKASFMIVNHSTCFLPAFHAQLCTQGPVSTGVGDRPEDLGHMADYNAVFARGARLVLGWGTAREDLRHMAEH